MVHFTQRFQYPGVYYALSHDRRHLELTEYWYAQHMGTWGQQPRGIFGADEQVRPGKVDPRQGFETCGMTEFAKSFYLLGQISGDPIYADRTEDIMLNHFPASQAPDLKGLHYLTASNMPQIDRSWRDGDTVINYDKGRDVFAWENVFLDTKR
ncbi:MAG: beta-L-arabinofuranosidase domain-containing protein [Victivallales bacterium]